MQTQTISGGRENVCCYSFCMYTYISNSALHTDRKTSYIVSGPPSKVTLANRAKHADAGDCHKCRCHVHTQNVLYFTCVGHLCFSRLLNWVDLPLWCERPAALQTFNDDTWCGKNAAQPLFVQKPRISLNQLTA